MLNPAIVTTTRRGHKVTFFTLEGTPNGTPAEYTRCPQTGRIVYDYPAHQLDNHLTTLEFITKVVWRPLFPEDRTQHILCRLSQF